ncbi:MAG: hypothetical protein CV087_06845 [Candidatus Brocadia sp. WS118]|nr:MAG: hypothetical protein CV087_06845 [Candidatus Brocadia sp. WS118]
MHNRIFRKSKTRNFTQIDNEFLTNPDLSIKAKGLLALMLSKPNNFRFCDTGLVKESKDGLESVKSALRELTNAGHVLKVRVKDESGKFIRWETLVFETPELRQNWKTHHSIDPDVKIPSIQDTQNMETPPSGKSAANNTDFNNTDEKNTSKGLFEKAGKTPEKSLRNRIRAEHSEYLETFEYYWNQYPNPEGKKSAAYSWNRTIRTEEDVQRFDKVFNNYLNRLRIEEWRNAMTGKNFFHIWQDYEDDQITPQSSENSILSTNSNGYTMPGDCL